MSAMPADIELVRTLVKAENGLAIIATTRADNTVHTSLVNAGVLDHPVTGQPVVGFVARGDALKLRLMRRNRRASVAFRTGWQWVAAEGPLDIIGPGDAFEGFDPAGVPGLLRDVFKAAGGTHEDWDTYDRVMAEERRTAVLVTPDRITSNA